MSGLSRLLSRLLLRPGRRTKELSVASEAPPSAADFKMMMENSRDIICRIDENNNPVYVSPAARRVLGWTPEEMILAGPNFIHPDDVSLVISVNERLFSGEKEAATVSFRLMSRGGAAVWVEANARRVREADGTPGDVVIVMRDVSDRRQLEEQLRAQAMTDGLTGLSNRRAFDLALDREWQVAVREGGQLSLLMLDVDNFKKFNDLYGHQAGDECLRVLATAVRRQVTRPGDLAARYGGEEIGIILPNIGADDAMSLAESVRAGIEALGVHHAGNSNKARTVTASVGVATAFARLGAAAQMPAGLVLAADSALYRAKQNGRNQVVATVMLAAPEIMGTAQA